MKKEKAVICTSLFAIVVIGAVICTTFIKNEYFNLYEVIASGVFIMWVLGKISDFYNWLSEE